MLSRLTVRRIYLSIAVATLFSLTASVPLTNAANGGSITVSNVEELYAAVDDTNNAGTSVILAPGTYTLSRNRPDGSLRTNAGRLELQPDMSLTGVFRNRSAVVIDGSGLPASSFSLPGPLLVGVIRVGRGSNAVEWLTITGNSLSVGSIDASLLSPQGSYVLVAHVTSTGSPRAVDVRNIAMPNRLLEAELIDNEFYGGFEGIRVLNTNNSANAVINVRMSHNYLHDNEHGCIIENSRSSSGHIEVRSFGDLITGNATGVLVGSGFIVGAGSANENYTLFEAHRSMIIYNTNPVHTLPWAGGIIAAGGMSGLQNATNNNRLEIKLVNCIIYGNQEVNVKVRGAFGFTPPSQNPPQPPPVAGSGNSVLVELRGISIFIPVDAAASDPVQPNETNSVEIIRKKIRLTDLEL